MKLPKCFFGWTNLKWLIKEFIAMYSNEDSYFSKKRFESSMAFLSGIGIILSFVWLHRATITNSEMLADAVILFGIAGYAVNQIQKEKKDLLQFPPATSATPIAPITEDLSKDEDAVK